MITVKFESIENFRDLGGYPCDYGETSFGVIYRSATLAYASEKDMGRLAEIGIKTVIDLREDRVKEELPNPADELTKEDKIYLAMKWGVYYRPNELIELERNYNEMIESFDIQDADTINSLKLICKTNLKMNQCVDSADIDGQQKLARVYDSLRKTAKFTAAQNKEEKGDFVDSIGNMVVLCEKEGGFIPRFATDTPQDKVDLVLKDNQDYLKKLVTQDLGFGQQIEDAIKKIQIQQEMNEKAEREEKMREQLKDADYVEQLKDENYREFYEIAEEQKAADEAFIEEDTQNELKTEQRIKVIKKKKG